MYRALHPITGKRWYFDISGNYSGLNGVGRVEISRQKIIL